jgi:hypothetical protein
MLPAFVATSFLMGAGVGRRACGVGSYELRDQQLGDLTAINVELPGYDWVVFSQAVTSPPTKASHAS